MEVRVGHTVTMLVHATCCGTLHPAEVSGIVCQLRPGHPGQHACIVDQVLFTWVDKEVPDARLRPEDGKAVS